MGFKERQKHKLKTRAKLAKLLRVERAAKKKARKTIKELNNNARKSNKFKRELINYQKDLIMDSS